MKTINISDETYESIKDKLDPQEALDVSCMEDLVGKKLFMRTVTYHMVGKVEKIVGHFLVLSDASWIPDSGRFMNFIKEGTLDEVEPVGEAYVNYEAITDFFPWKHSLPNKQK